MQKARNLLYASSEVCTRHNKARKHIKLVIFFSTDSMDFSGMSLIKLKTEEMDSQVSVPKWKNGSV